MMETRGSDPVIRQTASKTFDYFDKNNATAGDQSNRKRSHREVAPSDNQDSHTQPNGSRTSPKRPCTAEWPLKNDDAHSTTDQAQPSSSQYKKRGRKPRKSVFKEGSLNDKPSKKPLPEIVGDEEAMEAYQDAVNRKESSTDHHYEAGAESARPSGFFRFGKSIANALNPVTFWHGVWKDNHKDDNTPEGNADQGRKHEINKAYAELKDGGFKGVKSTRSHQSMEIPCTKTLRETLELSRNSFRDSGIDMGDTSTRNSQDTTHQQTLKLPPNTEIAQRATSPASQASSGRRSFTHLRSPSIQNLKKARSHIQMPSARRRTSAAQSIPSIDSVLAADANTKTIHRASSKKDLARVQKLNKRVSDLEAKLETARQQLEESRANAPPVPDLPVNRGRKSFVPGALPSLPSERLLARRERPTLHDSIVATVPNSTASTLNENVPPPSSADRVAKSWLNISPTKAMAGRTPPKRNFSSRRSSFTRSRKANRADHDANEGSPPLSKPKPPAVLSSARVTRNLTSPTPRNSPSQVRDTAVPPVPDINVSNATKPALPAPTLTPAFSPMHTRSKRGKENKKYSTGPSNALKREKKRGISPPPPSLSSARKTRRMSRGGVGGKESQDGGEVGKDGGVDGKESPVLGHHSTLATQPTKRVSRSALARGRDKPLPEIQKEMWEWGEDVF